MVSGTGEMGEIGAWRRKNSSGLKFNAGFLDLGRGREG